VRVVNILIGEEETCLSPVLSVGLLIMELILFMVVGDVPSGSY